MIVPDDAAEIATTELNLRQHTCTPMALRVSQSGRSLSAGADPAEVVLSSDGATHKLRCVAPVSSAALTHDGAIAATGDRGGLLTLWDTATGARGVQCVAASAVLAIAFSPDARAVASGRSDGATVWAVATRLAAIRAIEALC